MGITDLNRVYQIDDLAKGNVMFIATGVTNGAISPACATPGRGAHHALDRHALGDRNGSIHQSNAPFRYANRDTGGKAVSEE